MPGGDRTGPMGMGSRTGRGAGYCSGYNMPGFANPMPAGGFRFHRGMGRGFGRGRGWGMRRNGSYPYGAPYASDKEEAEILRDQVRAMQEGIEAMNARIKELESNTA